MDLGKTSVSKSQNKSKHLKAMKRSASPVLKVKLPTRVYSRKPKRPIQTSNLFTSQSRCPNYNLPDHHLKLLPKTSFNNELYANLAGDGLTKVNQHSGIRNTEVQQLENYTTNIDTLNLDSRIKQEPLEESNDRKYNILLDKIDQMSDQSCYSSIQFNTLSLEALSHKITSPDGLGGSSSTHCNNIADIKDCQVKQELDIGPTKLQKPDIYFTVLSTIKTETLVPGEDEPGPSELESLTSNPSHLNIGMSLNIELDVIKSEAMTVEPFPVVLSKECGQTPRNRSELQQHKHSCLVSRVEGDVISIASRHSKSTCDPRGIKKYRCPHCEYKAFTNWQLKLHLRRHTGDKLFKCNQCEYHTAYKQNLISHLKTHTGDKPFKCNQCEFRTAHKNNLYPHRKSHTGDKPLNCNHCQYRTAYKQCLISHMKTLTGDTPFKCNQCDYITDYKHSLTSHLRWVHTVGKQFKCNQCCYSSVNKSSLTKHSIMYTRDTPFKCNQCVYRTAYQQSLITHLRRVHAGDESCK